MIEHMVMWLIVAPLLAAGGPVRLALFACGRDGRRRLARWLHSRPVTVLTSPAGSVAFFSVVLLGTHLPSVYGLTLRNEWVHVCEHALYLVSSVLIWAPLLGVDPLPGRPRARRRGLCMAACMVPMAIVGVWLLAAGAPVYAHYRDVLGSAGALHDQRAAASGHADRRGARLRRRPTRPSGAADPGAHPAALGRRARPARRLSNPSRTLAVDGRRVSPSARA